MNPLIQNYSRENPANYWEDDYQLRVLMDVFVRGSTVFTQHESKFTGKLYCRKVIYQYPNMINTFQWENYCLNSKTFSKILFFCDS